MKYLNLKNYPSGDAEFDAWFEEINSPETVKQCQVDARKYAVYKRLEAETENPSTFKSAKKSRLLGSLLNLMEYLIGNSDINPLDRWFR